MIEVAAKLKKGSVYFAGETITYSLRFTNFSELTINSHSSGENETIAWVSAQIHCFCHINEARINFPQSVKKKLLASGTSFIPHQDEQGLCVFQTEVKILFCDLQLAPGKSVVYEFDEILPSNLPPSHRGRSCRYSYKLTIGTQRVGKSIQILRIPFRVLVIYGLTEYLMNQSNQPNIPSNPFLEDPASKLDLQEIASDLLNMMSSRKSSKIFQIRNSNNKKIGVFSLVKTSAKIGEDFVGTFDFSGSDIPCVQYTVCLQSEEVISEEYKKSANQSNVVVSYAKFNEFCLFTERTHVLLPVPLHVTPNCMTDLVCLKWKIHFEFTVMTSPLAGVQLDLSGGHANGDQLWQGPSNFETEIMTWNIPVHILPTLPSQAENPASSNLISILRF